ncbi:VirK family protein [Bradyrhizobium sp. CCGB20]|uniref:VirK family protein n=1 Tax=Bradyrhizobium sp. CCGB20 TaxID=2949633 RepID=UPI0020B35895|nr:VirK family protein [Bradyrhizobium sp. CCGB20]MCP3397195.1 VirK family protein [Bradyrhizobium sp. CCGB20]
MSSIRELVANTTSGTFGLRGARSFEGEDRMQFSGRRLSFLLSSLLLAASASTIVNADEPSPKYAEVLGALQAGKNVKLILDLSHCTTIDGSKPGPAVQGGLVLSAFRVSAQHGISFANAHQTVDTSGHPVTEYIRHSLNREGKLTVRASRLAAGATEVVNQGDFVCELPEGAKFVW